MANKYNSNIRTLVAKNIVWDSEFAYATHIAPEGLKTLAAPAALTLLNADMVEQPFQANWGSGSNINARTAWLPESNITLKSVGIFANFADGLVLSNISRRLVIEINSYIVSLGEFIPANIATMVDFTYDSNEVTGTDLDKLEADPGQPSFIYDGTSPAPENSNIYTMYDVAVDGSSARLSDFAYRGVGSIPYVQKLAILSTTALPGIRVPALNNLYAQEKFLLSSTPRGLSASASQFNILTAKISILPYEQDEDGFDFYTDVIDTGFNTKPVTFDAVMEVEVTPV
jgi:hypothetical protein